MGVVGLGGMGVAITRCLCSDGYEVVGYRRTVTALGQFLDAGGTAAGSLADLARMTSVVPLCLGSGRALQDVLNDLLLHVTPGTVLVEMSTLSIGDKEHARHRVEAAGCTLLDTPVSGTPAMVARGAATLFVSGEDAAIARITPVLRSIGRVRPMGSFGNGIRMKYVANALVATHTVAAAEAVAFAECLGLDTDLVVETISAGPATSAAFELRAARMATRDLTPARGSVAGLSGDSQLILEAANTAGATMWMLTAAGSIFDAAVKAGKGDWDVCSVIDVIQPPREEYLLR